MTITRIQNKYITELLNAIGIWQPPAIGVHGYTSHHLLPTLTDVQWCQSFETATTPQRENLARGWIWSYAVKNHNSCFDSYGAARDWCLERCASWLQKIEPYVVQQEFVEDDSPYRLAGAVLMRRATEQANTFLRPLWFGSNDEKLCALRAIPDDPVALGKITKSVASHNRVFEVLSLPGATPQDEICAAYIAMKSAILITNTTPAINEQFNQWHQLALSIARGMPEHPNELQRMINGKRFLQSQAPEIALPVITRIIHEELIEDSRKNRLNGMFWTPGGENSDAFEVTTENIYIALSEWFPVYQKQWGAAASLGLSVLEAGQIILLTMSDSGAQLELPDDIEMV
jgi:hypothetical protein